uniref:Carboxylesterase type B domain-containing protein n=1 Tax=Cyprinus carpio TaxID=7962 RepID=A0A8C1QQ34_CYPCA
LQGSLACQSASHCQSTTASPTNVSHPITKAQAQTASLARELARLASDTSQLLTCLRSKLAQSINAAQTKLAVSGPLQAWSPVVDGTVVWEKPSVALRSGHFNKVELLLGSSIEAGLISRAKNIEKNFEQLRGRTDSKTAFHAALYNVFSRALENATRDLFIICPAVDMAEFCSANTRSSVHIYHLPEDAAYNRSFTKRFSIHLSSAFHCHPNQPLAASRTSFSKFLPPWHQFMSHPGGRGYKQLSFTLNNRRTSRVLIILSASFQMLQQACVPLIEGYSEMLVITLFLEIIRSLSPLSRLYCSSCLDTF